MPSAVQLRDATAGFNGAAAEEKEMMIEEQLGHVSVCVPSLGRPAQT